MNESLVLWYEWRRVAMTVRDLVGLPDLRTWVHAGACGLDREVSWAHVCELPDPTEWLGAGDLLCTTGLGVPAGAEAQRAWLERIADAGLSGVAIGHRMHAPPVTAELCAAADARGVPVLFTSYEVPFSALARAVAEANRSEEHARVLETLRLYETLRHAAVGAETPSLLAQIEGVVGGAVHVVDHERGVSVMPDAAEPPRAVVHALREAVEARHGPMPAVLRITADAVPYMALAVPASRPVTLIVPGAGGLDDLAVLRQVAGIVALEVERESVERERRRAFGAELLGGLVDGRLDAEAAGALLDERGLAAEPRVLAACAAERDEHRTLHLRLEDRGVPHLLLRRAPTLLLLLRDDEGGLAALRTEVPASAPIGLSGPLGRPARAADAAREAVWALHAAPAAGAAVVRYGEAAPSLFLPRGLTEARDAAAQVLGPVMDYDAARDADLLRSLRVFLEQNRSWKDAAAALHVHKQTLVYRMRRVEELTGRRLADTSAIAELWLALKALEWSRGSADGG
ncbi:MAG TPA: PucR family transcriptional regulator ligand-binding domain-containing protein [Solirubrobacteraceae bacterium]|nr:PucR family transcriptional regulator ligand-binding domain-containing protein [Solirubrobacteraceae bacterium]